MCWRAFRLDSWHFYLYAYLFRELCEDIYFGILWDTLLFVLLRYFWNTFEISFWAPTCAIFLLILVGYKLVFLYKNYIYVSSLLSGAAFENMFPKFLKVIFLLFNKIKWRVIVIKIVRNSPSCRSFPWVTLSNPRGACCSPTSGAWHMKW